MAKEFSEGLKVWVRQSNCGYKGPATIVGGPVYGSAWLVQACKGDERIFIAKAEFLEVFTDPIKVPETASKEERKEIKKKLKTERKNHLPRKS